MNTFGRIYRLTSFGESHGKAVGGIIDGCPAGIELDFDAIQKELNRRKPGQSSISTPRIEDDKVEFLSGIFEVKTIGTPIGFLVWNHNQQSKDYGRLKDTFRPSHADFTYTEKYGNYDYRGGGRASVRETIARVVAGAIAKQILEKQGIEIYAYVSAVGSIAMLKSYHDIDLKAIDSNEIRCPDALVAEKMISLIKQVKLEGDSVGGVISCIIKNIPAGIGEPVFAKLNAKLGEAMLSINAVKGFEIGSGFELSKQKGSLSNDEFYVSEDNKIRTKSNNSGGIQGGISNGEDIFMKIAFKPVATIFRPQNTVNKSHEEVTLTAEGRHDPCVVNRAVPIVEAMAAMTILDYIMIDKAKRNC